MSKIKNFLVSKVFVYTVTVLMCILALIEPTNSDELGMVWAITVYWIFLSVLKALSIEKSREYSYE